MRRFERERFAALTALRSAEGRAVSFADLEAHGVTRPACVVYELEVAGWPITHEVVTDSSGHRCLGARLLVPAEADPPRGPKRRSVLAAVAGVFK